MSKEELKELLKEHLSVSIDDERIGREIDCERRITVRISFEGETISSDYFNLYD